MKKLVSISVLFLLLGCTEYDEVLLETQPNVSDLRFDNLNTDLPVINITVDQEEFDHIYANYQHEIEIDAVFSLYRKGIPKVLNKDIELEIKGGYSSKFSLKTLGIKFDTRINNLDRKLINPKEVLPGHNIDYLYAIRLRNSGNDLTTTMIKDISYTELAIQAGLDLDLMYSEQSVVFINNTFYGLMNIRTEGNTNGMAQLYNTSKKRITLGKNFRFKDGNQAKFEALISAIENNNTLYLKDNIDLSNLIDYTIFQCAINNSDWPNNNTRLYAIDDNKFRFVLYDLDWANGTFSGTPFLQNATAEIENSGLFVKMFNCLYKDNDFKKTFDNRANEIIKSNLLSTSKFGNIVHEFSEGFAKEMPLHIQKEHIGTIIKWYIDVDGLIVSFDERRKALNKEFN